MSSVPRTRVTRGFPVLLPLIPLFALLALPACQGDATSDPLAPDGASAARFGRHQEDATVAIPFEATLYTVPESIAPDPACGEPPFLRNVQVGEGTATHLGRFTVRLTFCMDATDVLDDGVLDDGESVPYDRGEGILVAANGDELHVTVAGAVLPSDDPAFDFEFHDPFQFAGGTGRFAGASGDGTTDSFVIQQPERTTHRWVGTLVVPRGGLD